MSLPGSQGTQECRKKFFFICTNLRVGQEVPKTGGVASRIGFFVLEVFFCHLGSLTASKEGSGMLITCGSTPGCPSMELCLRSVD